MVIVLLVVVWSTFWMIQMSLYRWTVYLRQLIESKLAKCKRVVLNAVSHILFRHSKSYYVQIQFNTIQIHSAPGEYIHKLIYFRNLCVYTSFTP